MQKIIALLLVTTACTTQRVAYQDEVNQQHQILRDAVRTELADAARQNKSVDAQLHILEERLAAQEGALERVSQQVREGVRAELTGIVDQLNALQQRQGQVLADMRKLASDADAKGQAIARGRDEVTKLRQDVGKQIQSCKAALESVVAFTQQGNQSYRVQRGDSLDKIAHRHGTSVDELKRLNGLTGDTIFPNQELRLPH